MTTHICDGDCEHFPTLANSELHICLCFNQLTTVARYLDCSFIRCFEDSTHTTPFLPEIIMYTFDPSNDNTVSRE